LVDFDLAFAFQNLPREMQWKVVEAALMVARKTPNAGAEMDDVKRRLDIKRAMEEVAIELRIIQALGINAATGI